MKKAIVTGGAGFIGSHIVDRLLTDGYDVCVIDDETSECHDKFYFNNKAVYVKKSVQDYSSIENYFNGVDVVFHVAAEARIQPSIENPILTAISNTVGTCSVLQAAHKHEVKRVIYSTTSSAYGNKNEPPYKETMIEDCLTPYSVTKVAGEKLCKVFYRLYGLKTISLRYFNVYGERQPLKGKYAPVVGLFQRQCSRGEPMTIVGDGKQTRDFTHVSDVVEANILSATTNNHKAFGEVFNIGTGINYDIISLAKMIGGPNCNITFIPPRKGESRNTIANFSKANEILGWKPKVQLPNWIKDHNNA